jgi:hypothetical protein
LKAILSGQQPFIDDLTELHVSFVSVFVQCIPSTLNCCLFFNIIQADKKLKHCLCKSSKPFYLFYSLILKIIASACDLPCAGVDPDQVLSELSCISFLFFGRDVVAWVDLLLPRYRSTRLC